MRKATSINNYENVQFTKHENFDHILVIVQYDSCSYLNSEEIGRFNFLENDGYIITPEGEKEYKRFSAILNTIFKHDSMFGYNFKVIEECKKEAQTIKQQEKKEFHQANKEAQMKKATDYLNKLISNDSQLIALLNEKFSDKTEAELITIINNTFKNLITKKLTNDILNAIVSILNAEDTTEATTEQIEEATTPANENTNTTEATNTYTVANKSFNTYEEAVTHCLQCDFDPDLMITKETFNGSPATKQPTTYQLYKHSFTTYNDAYNYACKNRINLTMILPSNYPMTHDRLIKLNKLFTFSKHRLNLDELNEYYNFISSCPVSLDQEDIYYSLISLIKRKEDSIKRQQEEKQRLNKQCQEVSNMLKTLHDHGVTTKENTYSTSYYYNDELLYSWSSGITVEKQHTELSKVYNNFMNSLQTA